MAGNDPVVFIFGLFSILPKNVGIDLAIDTVPFDFTSILPSIVFCG